MADHREQGRWSTCGLAGELALLLEMQAATGCPPVLGLAPLLSSPQLTIVGLDEAGRGCVAGPVVAGATAWTLIQDSTWQTQPPTHRAATAATSDNWKFMRDSKRLTAQRREHAAALLTGKSKNLELVATARNSALGKPVLRQCQHHLPAAAEASPEYLDKAFAWLAHRQIYDSSPLLGVGLASCSEIESLNIWEATQLAIGRALGLLYKVEGPAVVFFDGKLPCKLPEEFGQIPLVTLIKADDKLRSVSAAGIVAKVTRDQMLTHMDQLFPEYGFAKHKGYGTAEHFAAIRARGVTPEHRTSFLSRIIEPTLF